MLLSALSLLVVAQSSSEVPEGLMNNPVYCAKTWKTKNKNKERAQVFRDVVMCRWLSGDTPQSLHDTFNLAIILQYFTILNYELFCKRNGNYNIARCSVWV